jgi:putative aldouronate transport system permease protein
MGRREILGKGQKTFNVLNYSLMAVFVCLIILPFIHVLSVSFSTQTETARYGLHLFPREITTEAYRRIFKSSEIWRAYIVTILRTGLGTTLSLILTALGGYVLSKKYLPHRVFYTSVIVFTMFFSGGLIPTFLLVRSLGLLDSYLSLLLPNAINAFYLLIMRNYFMTIPVSLEDSARIDGAADWRILFSIYMPVAKPIIATIGLWYAVSNWNAWFDCLIYIRNPNKFVLQIILRRIILEGTRDITDNPILDESRMAHPDSVRAAAIFVTTIPIILVYPFIQKYFVKGIMIGSLKG